VTVEEEQLVADLHEEVEALHQQVEYLRMGMRLLKQAAASKMTLEEWVAEFNRLEPKNLPEQDPVIRGGISLLEDSLL
jgi:prefoldin subunit 5